MAIHQAVRTVAARLLYNVMISGILCGAVAEIARWIATRDSFHVFLGVVLAVAYTIKIRDGAIK